MKKNIVEAHFAVKKPCENCPFRKDGAISLNEGRLDGIIANLISDDRSTFQCHKTVHNASTGGEWDDEGEYRESGRESMCAGAIIYLEKFGRPTVRMRIAEMIGAYSPPDFMKHSDLIIDPKTPK